MTRPEPLMRATGIGALAGAAALSTLQWLGGRLDRPDDMSLAALEAWYQSVDPVDAGAAAIWVVATLLTVWFLVAAALQVLAALAGGGRLRGAADAISPRSLQRFGHGLAGLSLSAGLAVAPSAGIPLPSDQPSSRPTELIAEEPSSAQPPASEAPSSGTATMTRIEAEVDATPTTVAPTTTTTLATTPSTASSSVDPTGSAPPVTGPVTTTTTAPAPAEGADPGAADDSAPVESDLPLAPPAEPVVMRAGPPSVPTSETGREGAGGAEVVVVEPGMSFWSIAEEVVAERSGPVDERAVSRYWQALIAANRDRLVVPGNADLLFPGQELVLPAT